MSQSLAQQRLTQLSGLVAALALALLVIAGIDLGSNSTAICAGWGDCSGWATLTDQSTISRIHLIVAGMTGLATLAMIGYAWTRMRDDKRVLRAGMLGVLAIGAQIVAVSLPANGSTAAWGAALHLGATAVLLAIALYLGLLPTLATREVALSSVKPLRGLIALASLLTLGILTNGGFIQATDNAGVCTGWPVCDTSTVSGFLPLSAQGMHRWLVGLAIIALVGLTLRIFRNGQSGRLVKGLLLALLGVFAIETIVGAFSMSTGQSALAPAAHFGAAGASWMLLIVLGLVAGTYGGVQILDDVQAEPVALTGWRATARDYFRVTKPGIMLLLLTTTLGAMLIAGPWPSFGLVLLTMLGGAMASGGASALNCYIDRDIDPIMARTRKRPLPTGSLTPAQVRNFGLALSVGAVLLLWAFVNPLAALLAGLGNIYYVQIYSGWLKRSTPQNIVIGGGAGAFPPLVGWAAVTGSLSVTAILLFAIIFYWTPPHFWSLALLKKRDYERAGVPMLPVTHGAQYTRKMILLYSLLLVGITILIVPAGGAGSIYLALAVVLGGIFISYAWRMYREQNARLAWPLFKFSNYYLALMLAALVVDRAI